MRRFGRPDCAGASCGDGSRCRRCLHKVSIKPLRCMRGDRQPFRSRATGTARYGPVAPSTAILCNAEVFGVAEVTAPVCSLPLAPNILLFTGYWNRQTVAFHSRTHEQHVQQLLCCICGTRVGASQSPVHSLTCDVCSATACLGCHARTLMSCFGCTRRLRRVCAPACTTPSGPTCQPLATTP